MPRRLPAGEALLAASPLLITEFEDEFNQIRDALNKEINPRGIIEEIYVWDIADLLWEILRLRRCRAVIINCGYRPALVALLQQCLREPGLLDSFDEMKAQDLAIKWFTNEDEGKAQVLKLLAKFQLDELSIEAESIRTQASDLERLDRLLSSLETRRDKALQSIAEFRGGLAKQLRESGARMIENKVHALEDSSRANSGQFHA